MKVLTDQNDSRIAWHLFAAIVILYSLISSTLSATELNGRITVGAIGSEILPGAGIIDLPLKDISVHLGIIERDPSGASDPQALVLILQSSRTDNDGEYSFDLGPDPDPGTPPSEIEYAIVVILESAAVAVYDYEFEQLDTPGKPACMGTNLIRVPDRGVSRADIQIIADGNVNEFDSDYTVRGTFFDPVLDFLTAPVFGMRPDCDEAVLTASSFLGAGYDQRGITNLEPKRFAHLAVQYVRAYDAYEFVIGGLLNPFFTKVNVKGWYTPGGDGMSYQCSAHTIRVDNTSSNFFNKNDDSRLYAMRHEYGHHFMCASSIANTNMIPPYIGGDTNHGGLENDNSTDSWIEGFASYFAAAVAEFNGETSPHLINTKSAVFDLQSGRAQLDNPVAAGEQRVYGILGEEFSVASLLWRISQPTGSRTLIDSFEASGAGLVTFADVYNGLRSDPSIASHFNSQCSFNDLFSSIAAGIDCVFIDLGFYHDADGDGFYSDSSEFISAHTRWPLTGTFARGATDVRPATPILDGSILRLHTIDTAGQPVAVNGFEIEIQYDAPFEHASFEYIKRVSWDGPYEFPVLVPARPSRAVITAMKDGLVASPPLVIESEFFHESVDPFRSGGVAPILVEHTYTLRTISELEPVSDLSARAKSGKINIVWSPVADAVSYNVFRREENSNYNLVAGGHISNYAMYAESGLTNGVTYSYVVTWIDSNGEESVTSNTATATPVARRARRD